MSCPSVPVGMMQMFALVATGDCLVDRLELIGDGESRRMGQDFLRASVWQWCDVMGY